MRSVNFELLRARRAVLADLAGLPPIALQAEYSKFIERSAATRGTFQRRGDRVEDLFNSLVARAFSGAPEAKR